MKDEIYIGNLVSPDELRHSAKGSQWKNHKYVKKENGRYWYPDDIAKNNRKAGGKNPTEEDISNAEEAYNQAVEEYSSAKKAYNTDPSEINKKKLNDAEKKLDIAGTGQGYADAYRRSHGQKEDKTVKELVIDKAKKRLFNK